MGENSAIEWTDHTFNPWWGCTKVSPGCDHCYAEAFANRLMAAAHLWDGNRRTFHAQHWANPIRWNKAAERQGKRSKVFCASMADVFDKDGPARERLDLWDLIEDTPHLDWLLLTKRVSNVRKLLPEAWLESPRPNVWIGISVVTQDEADRDIPRLLQVPAAFFMKQMTKKAEIPADLLVREFPDTSSPSQEPDNQGAKHDTQRVLEGLHRERQARTG